MKRLLILLGLVLTTLPPALAQQEETYDYQWCKQEIVDHGMQALLMCNGLFTSDRSLEQLFEQELKVLDSYLGKPHSGDYEVDWERKTVMVDLPGSASVMRAAYREGLGCIVLAPNQTFEDIDSLPVLQMPPLAGDPSTIPWPDGDLIEDQSLPPGVDQSALEAAADWAFNQQADKLVTLSLIVVYKGQIVLERYAPGIEVNTKTRIWSVSKSIAATLIGITVDQGKLSLDGPLELEWLPQVASPETDPRREITLRHLLNMASGLDPWQGPVQNYGAGSKLAYFGGASSVNLALSKGLVRKPGTFWNYDNHNIFLEVHAMKKALGSEQAYLEFPRRALLDRIGMRNTVLGVDRFGDFVMSSQIYSNARDLARFGMLYQQNGVWNGERILSEEWIEFVRTPVPLKMGIPQRYGGHWWLPADDLAGEFPEACTATGSWGQYVIVIPSRELVIVRRGMDYAGDRLDPTRLALEVVKAFPQ
ncbi:MAG: beta-lactamase family protein [Phaeodactylibacter sp.]|nr:beta-lactamase family protein [Phaeodactylibacter sp.]